MESVENVAWPGHPPPMVIELGEPGHPRLGGKVVDVDVHVGVLRHQFVKPQHGHAARVVVG